MSLDNDLELKKEFFDTLYKEKYCDEKQKDEENLFSINPDAVKEDENNDDCTESDSENLMVEEKKDMLKEIKEMTIVGAVDMEKHIETEKDTTKQTKVKQRTEVNKNSKSEQMKIKSKKKILTLNEIIQKYIDDKFNFGDDGNMAFIVDMLYKDKFNELEEKIEKLEKNINISSMNEHINELITEKLEAIEQIMVDAEINVKDQYFTKIEDFVKKNIQEEIFKMGEINNKIDELMKTFKSTQIQERLQQNSTNILHLKRYYDELKTQKSNIVSIISLILSSVSIIGFFVMLTSTFSVG